MSVAREFTRQEVVNLANALGNLRVDLGIINDLLLQSVGMTWSQYTAEACMWEMDVVNEFTNAVGRTLAQLLSEEAHTLAQ